jgi:hypothetical protein
VYLTFRNVHPPEELERKRRRDEARGKAWQSSS